MKPHTVKSWSLTHIFNQEINFFQNVTGASKRAVLVLKSLQYASSGNHHFLQHYVIVIPPKLSKTSSKIAKFWFLKSFFRVEKWRDLFLNNKTPTFDVIFFWKLGFLKHCIFFFVGSVHNLVRFDNDMIIFNTVKSQKVTVKIVLYFIHLSFSPFIVYQYVKPGWCF